jgi:hypothetical protein
MHKCPIFLHPILVIYSYFNFNVRIKRMEYSGGGREKVFLVTMLGLEEEAGWKRYYNCSCCSDTEEVKDIDGKVASKTVAIK